MAERKLFFGLFFLLRVPLSGFSDVVSQDVQVTAGDNVTLPCHLDPPFDVSDLTVHWKRNDSTVHAYRNRDDYYDAQDQHFRGRTSMFHGELTRGNISLKLTNVSKEDSGLYICYVPRLNSQVKRGNVNLTVNPQNEAGGQGAAGSGGDKTGVIVGSIIVIGLLLVIGIILSLKTGFIGRWRRRRNNQDNNGSNEQEMNPMNPPASLPQ